MLSSDAIDEELQDQVDAALSGNKLSIRQRSQIANPGDHPSILRLLCKVPWIVKNWPIQTFMDRVLTRHRFHVYWKSLPTLEDQLRVRSKLNPMSGVPLRAIPSSPLTQLLDEEVVWIMLDRLGIDHPETAAIKKCTCGADMKGGRHALRCKIGGGPTIHHDAMKVAISEMSRDAGVVVQLETRNLLPGTAEKPADILALGIGNQGRDVAHDVAIVDPQQGAATAELQRRAYMTSLAARRREAQKRDKRREAGGPTTEERLRQRGIDCIPLIFEVDGATTGTWARYLNKLSEIAHTRRGHNKTYFAARWRTRIAMTLARRGAQVAIRRSHHVSWQGDEGDDDAEQVNGFGPLGSHGVEMPTEMGGDEMAQYVNYCDGGGDGGDGGFYAGV